MTKKLPRFINTSQRESAESLARHPHPLVTVHTPDWYSVWKDGRCPTCGVAPRFETIEYEPLSGGGITMIRGKGFGEGLSR